MSEVSRQRYKDYESPILHYQTCIHNGLIATSKSLLPKEYDKGNVLSTLLSNHYWRFPCVHIPYRRIHMSIILCRKENACSYHYLYLYMSKFSTPMTFCYFLSYSFREFKPTIKWHFFIETFSSTRVINCKNYQFSFSIYFTFQFLCLPSRLEGLDTKTLSS